MNELSALFDFIAALATGTLAGLGVGGGGLLVLWLTFVTGTEQLAAQGMNLVFYITASLASLPIHIKSRRLVSCGIILGLTGAAGAVIGCIAPASLESSLLRRIFGGFLANVRTMVAGGTLRGFLEKAPRLPRKPQAPPKTFN